MASAGFDALETAVQVKTALTTIGSPPVEESTYKVNGEETDRLVNGMQDSWLYMTALVAIVSAGRLYEYCARVRGHPKNFLRRLTSS